MDARHAGEGLTGNPENSRTPETITTTELSREGFYAYLPTMEGPHYVELVIEQHTSDTRPKLADTFRVLVNGEHRWGGFASHLPQNGPEGLGGFVRWTAQEDAAHAVSAIPPQTVQAWMDGSHDVARYAVIGTGSPAGETTVYAGERWVAVYHCGRLESAWYPHTRGTYGEAMRAAVEAHLREVAGL